MLQTVSSEVKELQLGLNGQRGFALGFKNPQTSSAAVYSIKVQTINISALAAPPLSNSAGLISSSYDPPARSDKNLMLIGYVLSCVLLVLGLLYRGYGHGRYNPVLMTQLIYLSLFFKETVTTSYFYYSDGFRFADL